MRNRKVVSFILTLSLLFCPFSTSFAASEPVSASSEPVAFSDLTDHWASAAVLKWAGYGIINGYEGLFRPDDPITRGEMAVILDNMMDYQKIASNTFIDLQTGQFYTEAVLKANAAGIMKGDGVTVRPLDKITKEEAAIMLSRAFAVSNAISTKAFLDASAVSDWAKGAVFGMEAKGYVSGFEGYFNPRNNITRAEAVTMINNIVKAYYTAAGTYTDDVAGTAVIKVPDVVLKGLSVSENLIIAEGVGNGDATLNSVTVKGETVIRGGGENSVHITGRSVITKVTIEKVGDKVRVVVDDGITVSNVEVAAGEEIILTGSVGSIELSAPNATVYANSAEINSATITGDNSTIVVGAQSTLNNITVPDTTDKASVKTESGSVVKEIVSSAEVQVSGTGAVNKVTLKAGADGSSVTTPNTSTTVPAGVTGVTGGGGATIPAGSTGTNGSSGTTVTVVATSSTSGSGGGGGSSTTAVTGVEVTSSAITITTDNGTLQMTAIVAPTNATNKNVTWSVTNGTGYATINSSGLLTAVSNGSVTVTAVSVENGTVSGSLGITLSGQTNDAIAAAAVTITSPAAGEPGMNASISSSANYTLESTTWSGKLGTNYAIGETPAAIITLKANIGYTFTGLAAGSISAAGGTVTYDGGQGVVSGGAFVVFTVTYPQLTASITSVNATCTGPAIGEAGASAAVGASANYTHTSTTWSGRSGGTFVAGDIPIATVTLTAKTGYGFTGLSASNIAAAGGGPVSYGIGQGVTAGGASVIFSVAYPQLIGTLASATVTITAPVLGATPVNAAAVQAATSNAAFTVSNVTWNGTLTSTGKFKADTAYSATVVLTSKNFIKFNTGGITPTGAGIASISGGTTTGGDVIGNTASFTAYFATTGALAVSSISLTNQPSQMSYMENTALNLSGLAITETYNDSSTGSALFPGGVNAGYSANPANGTILTTAYNGTPVAITHLATGKIVSTSALSVASTVSAISSADVSLTQGSIIFAYAFNGTNGAITYTDALAGPYYLDAVQSTVMLKNGSYNTAAVSVSALGLAADGTVSYAAISGVESAFPGLNFVPTQVAISLKGATSVNGGANQWTYNVNVDLDPAEIALLTRTEIGSLTVSVTPPSIGATLYNASVAPGSNCTHTTTTWTGKVDTTYAAGETPAAIITLAANTDYTFTGMTAGDIIVSGGTVSFAAGQGVTSGGMTLVFTVSYPQLIAPITTAGAICTAPAVGEAAPPPDAVVVSSTYSHASTVWSGASGGTWVADETPVAVITLAANPGYTFTGLAAGSITVAGGTVSYESGQGVTSGGMEVVFTVTYPQLLAASTPAAVVLAAGSINGVLNVANVSIPAAGATDSTGSVDWNSGTNDKIKFTVTDAGSAASTITINGAAYTSGADYTLTGTGILTVIVTTTETGKATCVRTFAVSVTQAAFASTPGSIILGVGSTNSASISSGVVIPANGGTDTSGAVSDWVTGTNDRIKFTVTDAGGTSAIKINGSGYTNGSDYQITTTGSLSIVVTTTETNKVTAIRTFLVPVSAAPYASTPSSVTLGTGSTSSAAINTNISTIPGLGATNTEGVVNGWNAGTSDRITFNVADAPGAASTITINGSAYTSGSDYTITGAGILTIVVTTTEAGRTPSIRTFSVNVVDNISPEITAISLHDISSGIFGDEIDDQLKITFSEAMDTSSKPTALDLDNLLTFSGTNMGSCEGSNFSQDGLTISFSDATTLLVTVTDPTNGINPIVTDSVSDKMCVTLVPLSSPLMDMAGRTLSGPTAGSDLIIGTY